MKKVENITNKKLKINLKTIIKLAMIIAFLLFLIVGLYNKLCIKKYVVESDKIENRIRIALISDLHSCQYGEKQQELIEAVDAQHPDLILMTGDIFDDAISDANTEYFLQGIAEKYPCYYVTGNHEYWSGSTHFHEKMNLLEQHHVNILSGTWETITVQEETINLCGVDDPDAYLIAPTANPNTQHFTEQLNQVKMASENGYYTILLSHRPEYFDLYVDSFDLVLCGHAHGGQWRIPGLLNGLYAPDQGLFPKYAGGDYQGGNTTMIVSRGLARESTRIPRFYNWSELVVIDLQ